MMEKILPVRGQRTSTNARTRKGPRKMAIKKKIESGMPAEFIVLSWGDPIRNKTSLDGLPILVYEDKGDKRHELMLKDGRLKQWGREKMRR